MFPTDTSASRCDAGSSPPPPRGGLLLAQARTRPPPSANAIRQTAAIARTGIRRKYQINDAPLRSRYFTSTIPRLWSDTTLIHTLYLAIQRRHSDSTPWQRYDAT